MNLRFLVLASALLVFADARAYKVEKVCEETTTKKGTVTKCKSVLVVEKPGAKKADEKDAKKDGHGEGHGDAKKEEKKDPHASSPPPAHH